MATRAADVQQARAPSFDVFHEDGSRWWKILRDHKAAVGFTAATGLIVTGWLLRDRNLLSAEHGVGYALGVGSVACMSILLLYPLRKRFRRLKFLGPLPKWFRNHMFFGVCAPIAALYHCNFQLGSLNSRIALFSALTVAGSGLIGRFIYSKIHHGLYGRKANLKELLKTVKVTTPGVGKLGTFIPELTARITRFDREVLVPPKTLLECVRLPVMLAVKTRLHRRRLRKFTRASLAFHAKRSEIVAQHSKQLETVIDRYVANHLGHVQRVASFTAYDRLFALWHKVHLPFFIVLLITVAVHVAVVHLY